MSADTDSLDSTQVRDPASVRTVLVRGPIVGTIRSVNNEATPCLGLAYLAAYAGKHGYMERFWRAGKSYGVQSERDMPIMASRGCPYQCTFCSSPQMWTTRYILRDIDDLIAEIKTYIAKHDATALQFYDLTAVTKRGWAIEFCRRLLAEGINIKWSLPSGTRSEALDAETLSYLKRSGCNYLVYAPESGSPETLKKIKKRINLERLTQSVIEAKQQGIIVRTNLIIGFPDERRSNVFETIRYGLYRAMASPRRYSSIGSRTCSGDAPKRRPRDNIGYRAASRVHA